MIKFDILEKQSTSIGISTKPGAVDIGNGAFILQLGELLDLKTGNMNSQLNPKIRALNNEMN